MFYKMLASCFFRDPFLQIRKEWSCNGWNLNHSFLQIRKEWSCNDWGLNHLCKRTWLSTKIDLGDIKHRYYLERTMISNFSPSSFIYWYNNHIGIISECILYLMLSFSVNFSSSDRYLVIWIFVVLLLYGLLLVKFSFVPMAFDLYNLYNVRLIPYANF
jgi:hypothetical protein